MHKQYGGIIIFFLLSWTVLLSISTLFFHIVAYRTATVEYIYRQASIRSLLHHCAHYCADQVGYALYTTQTRTYMSGTPVPLAVPIDPTLFIETPLLTIAQEHDRYSVEISIQEKNTTRVHRAKRSIEPLKKDDILIGFRRFAPWQQEG